MNPECIKSYDAGAAIGSNLICKPGAADGAVLVAAACTDLLFGVSTNVPAASGERCDIIHDGIAFILLGGAVTRGQMITADANAKGVAATKFGMAVGQALVSGVAGDIIPAKINPQMYNPENEEALVLAAADGAIGAKRGVVIVTKGTAAALTLAAPTAATDDGKRLTIIAGTAAAHTVANADPGFNGGGAAKDTATFGGAIGDSIELVAYNGNWLVINLTNVTLG